MNSFKLLLLITSIIIVATPLAAWYDSVLFGWHWTDWLLGCAFEMGAFICGLWVGWILSLSNHSSGTTMKRRVSTDRKVK